MRVRGLDFLRAIAIISVLLFHFYPHQFSGGFLGVDLFFAISGFIITFLLYSEHKTYGRIDFKLFYIKRIKRIVPALLFMVICVMGYLYLKDPSLFYAQLNDAIFGCFFLTNWFNIYNSISYFDLNIYPFKHLWSIAIEEQFYLVYPLILSLIITKCSHYKSIFILSFLAFSSFLLMFFLFDPSNVEFVYYNFFTRFFAFLIGGIFAIIFYYLQKATLQEKSIIRSLLSLCLIILFIPLLFCVNEQSAILYHGGLLFFYILSGTLILLLALPGNIFVTYLENGVIKYIANRSYSIYLWHYPIIVLALSPAFLSKQSLVTTTILLILILVIAEFSYQVIEKPLRFHHWRSLPKMTITAFTICSLIFICIMIPSVKNIGAQEISTVEDNSDAFTYINTTYTMFNNLPSAVEDVHLYSESVTNTEDMYSRPIIVFGDSIALNYESLIEEHFEDVTYVAEVGLQMYDLTDQINQYSSYNTEETIVVLNIGTNGTVKIDELEYFIQTFDKCDIFLVNTAAEKYWADEVNQNLAVSANEHENVYLVDWQTKAKDHPEYFGTDGIHLTNAGINALVTELEKTILNSY